MSQFLNLPVTEVNKFIVVDEGVKANFAECLIIAWLQIMRKKGMEVPIKILLFSSPKRRLDKCLKSLSLTNYEIKDYHSIDVKDQETDVYQDVTDFVYPNLSSIFVINCLNTLALQVGPAKACRFVEKLYQNQKSQVFCIYRRDFPDNIPRIETLGNIYVKIRESKKVGFDSNIHYEASTVHRKPGGSIVKWDELVSQNIDTFSLECEKITENSHVRIEKQPEITMKPEASFRIEMSDKEMKQRDSVPLPYILRSNPSGQSKIIYVPDENDDMDEEDPDEDLDF